jgi:hypothetical protein
MLLFGVVSCQESEQKSAGEPADEITADTVGPGDPDRKK